MLGMAAIKAGKLDEARTTLASLLADRGLSRTASERINRLMADIASAELSGTPSSVSGQIPAPVGDAEKPASAP